MTQGTPELSDEAGHDSRKSPPGRAEAVVAVGDLASGLQTTLSAILTMMTQASFQLVGGVSATGALMKWCLPLVLTTPDKLLCIAAFGIGVLLGRLVDDVYDATRVRFAKKREKESLHQLQAPQPGQHGFVRSGLAAPPEIPGDLPPAGIY